MEAKTNTGNGTSPADRGAPAKFLPDAPPVGQIPPAQAPAEADAERAADAERSARPGTAERIANGAVRGVVAAMAMTGFREFTRRVGLLQEPPPEAIVRQRLLGRFRRARSGRSRAGAELLHWGYGAAGGAAFAALPEGIRRPAPSGPLYGLVVWTGFELGIAPLLKLQQAKQARPLDRAALALDHALYGFIVSGLGGRSPR